MRTAPYIGLAIASWGATAPAIRAEPVEIMQVLQPSGPAYSPQPMFPARETGAPSGSRFVERYKHAPAYRREAAILDEVRRGNVPAFLRTLRPVRVKVFDADRRMRRVTFWVLPDYLALGDDADFVRMPMTPLTAQRLADELQLALPTPKMVDLIYMKAEVKLQPAPLPRSRAMTSAASFLVHHEVIEGQRAERAIRDPASANALIAGHKKDVVLSRRLQRRPSRVAIYGWHEPDGVPLQPLSLAHDELYADYSHGVRLVHPIVLVDGVEHSIDDLLRDPKLAATLSDEGRLLGARLPSPEGAPRAQQLAGRARRR